MKKLMILRHTKADWAPNTMDKNRPLDGEGYKQAELIFNYIKNNGIIPSVILCSSALRTRETVAPIESKTSKAKILYKDDLYQSTVGQLYEAVKALPDDCDRAMIVAHNPGVHGLALFLMGEADDSIKTNIQVSYKPGTLAMFECDVNSWADVMPAQNTMVELLSI